MNAIKVVAYNSSNETAIAVAERNFVGFPWSYIVEIIGVIAVGFVIALVVAVFALSKQQKRKEPKWGKTTKRKS